MSPAPQPRSAATTLLAVTDTAVALTFLTFALLHAGLPINRGFAVLAEPRIPPATVVELLCGLVLAGSATAVFSRQGWSRGAALAAHLFALSGVLLGIVAGIRGGGSTESNTTYHIVVLTALLALLTLLLTARSRATLDRDGAELPERNASALTKQIENRHR